MPLPCGCRTTCNFYGTRRKPFLVPCHRIRTRQNRNRSTLLSYHWHKTFQICTVVRVVGCTRIYLTDKLYKLSPPRYYPFSIWELLEQDEKLQHLSPPSTPILHRQKRRSQKSIAMASGTGVSEPVHVVEAGQGILHDVELAIHLSLIHI